MEHLAAFTFLQKNWVDIEAWLLNLLNGSGVNIVGAKVLESIFMYKL